MKGFSPCGTIAQNQRQQPHLESNDCLTLDECVRPVEGWPFEGRVRGYGE